MASPIITAFGDGDHIAGDDPVLITGGFFGEVEGAAKLCQNNSLAAPGTVDDVTTFNSWHDGQISIGIPDPMTNSTGTLYLFVKNAVGEWSAVGFPFTLSGEIPVGPGTVTLGSGDMLNLVRMM